MPSNTCHATAPEAPPDLGRRRRLGAAATNLALGALIQAHDLLGRATGRHLREARAQEEPLPHVQGRLEEAELKARLAWKVVEILQARLARIPERRRPHYSPAQRFRVLEIKRLMGWTLQEAGDTFLVCPNTIGNWEGQVRPGLDTVGSIVKPVPPVVRMSDAVRSLVQSMKRLGFGSDDLIARTLVRAGWEISVRSVGRIVREALRPAPSREPPPADRPKPQRPVKADFVHHVWMADVSEVRAFLGGTFHMAAIFDAYSRVPLALQTFDRRPSSRETAGLLERSVQAFGQPRHVITDLGSEFKGNFERTLERLGVVQRWRRKDCIAATARLESFWRTLKNTASLRLPVFLTLEDLERRLAPALLHYVHFRPHHGLHGATPAEVFLGLELACRRARRAPRGQPSEGPPDVPFRVVMLAPRERLFPIFVPATA